MTNEEIVQMLQGLIGTTYAPSVKAHISDVTGRAVVIGPNELHSKIFDPERVHIQADTNGIITGFAFN
ncbi:hypothetical protein [Pseudomonas japonica]|uniref:hypothetical protein n=1 Tax=Pseudomonas japonica TaxID=256466 RepID=UPI0015E3BF9F|nr:hypothetical protein [Pseudomonas japonica]MBA1241445.1 hypothetical protein [Pseudomonas japonica]MBA1287957.1 hypothetical protein [Pseudomonas japonica]